MMMVKKKRKYSAKTKGRMFIIFSFIGFIIVTLGYTLLINVREIKELKDEMDRLN